MRPLHATLFLLLLALPACENGGTPVKSDQASPDFGPTAAYNRRLLFLGPDGEQPATAIFDFTALSDSIGIRRGVRARVLEDGGRWRDLVDAGWEMAPMREPWRIVPHGPLTMVVTGTGDLGALVCRDSTGTTRLELGPALAEHSPDVGTQLVLRGARLVQGADTVTGVVLDAQLGRAVNPRLVARSGRTPADSGDVAADTAASPTPIARPGDEALLMGDSDYYLVLATASGGSLAWVRAAGQSDVRRGARLEPTAWTPAEEDSVQVPTAWRLVSDGELTGELTAVATDRMALDGTRGPEALSYTLVTGWVEDRSVRRDVYGLVRHVR